MAADIDFHSALTSYFADHNKFHSFYLFTLEADIFIANFHQDKEVYIKALDYKLKLNLENTICNQATFGNREIENYDLVKHLCVTPQLLSHDCITIPNLILTNHISSVTISYMIIEKWGQSLYHKYIEPQREQICTLDFLGPGISSEVFLYCPQQRDYYFPVSIPTEIMIQVYNIVLLLYQNNVRLNDIHTGNWIEKDGLVKVIDLEDVTITHRGTNLLVNNSLAKAVKILDSDINITALQEAYDNGARNVTMALLAMIKIEMYTDTITTAEKEIYQFLIKQGAQIPIAIDYINEKFPYKTYLLQFLQK